MLIFVVCTNCAIALFNFVLAGYIWRSHRQLRQITIGLNNTEQSIHESLSLAPYVISLGQVNIRRFRLSSRIWGRQWGQLQQTLSAVVWMRQLQRRRSKNSR